MTFKEPKDNCVHGRDRWNQGCQICDSLNDLANKNVTLQKLTIDDFKLTEEQMKQKYHISQNDLGNQKESEKTIFPKYISEVDAHND